MPKYLVSIRLEYEIITPDEEAPQTISEMIVVDGISLKGNTARDMRQLGCSVDVGVIREKF